MIKSPTKLKLKVCGMKYASNITEVAGLFPDYMGFIFYSGSKRNAQRILKPEMVKRMPRSIKRVGVFVNSTADTIRLRVKEFALNYVQLHGNESPAFCAAISKMVPVIKAFGVDEDFDFGFTAAYAGSCSYFLFDTRTKKHGGSGKRFDWRLLNAYRGKTPYFLSGGIGEEEVSTLMGILQTNGQSRMLTKTLKLVMGIDVNSRVEKSPGWKDIEQLKRLKKRIDEKHNKR